MGLFDLIKRFADDGLEEPFVGQDGRITYHPITRQVPAPSIEEEPEAALVPQRPQPPLEPNVTPYTSPEAYENEKVAYNIAALEQGCGIKVTGGKAYGVYTDYYFEGSIEHVDFGNLDSRCSVHGNVLRVFEDVEASRRNFNTSR